MVGKKSLKKIFSLHFTLKGNATLIYNIFHNEERVKIDTSLIKIGQQITKL